MLYSRISSLSFGVPFYLDGPLTFTHVPVTAFFSRQQLTLQRKGRELHVIDRLCNLHDFATRFQSSNLQYRAFPKAFDSLWERSSWWRAKLQDLSPLAHRLSKGATGHGRLCGERLSKPFLASSRSLPLFFLSTFHHPSTTLPPKALQ